jgi:hypothetical protein
MLLVEETELPVEVCATPTPLPAPARLLATAANVSSRLTADISDAVKLGSLTLMLDVEDFSDDDDVSICRVGGGGGQAGGGGGGVIGRSASPKSAGRSEKSSSLDRPVVGFLFELDAATEVAPGWRPLSENRRFIGGGVH